MTPREAERRLHLLEGTMRARYPDPAPPASELERWAATLSDDALVRVEQLCRTMADDPERDGQPMTELDRALVECACLDADLGDADPVRRSYLAGQPHDPTDPAMAELRAGRALDHRPDRVFMSGADVRGWLAWHGIVVDQLVAGRADPAGRAAAGARGPPDRGRGRADRCALGRGRERRPPQAAWDGVINSGGGKSLPSSGRDLPCC